MKKQWMVNFGVAFSIFPVSTIQVMAANLESGSNSAIPTAQSSAWDNAYGGADKSYDTELLRLRAQIAPRFKTLQFHDSVTGKTMAYNLYTPKNYDPKKRYPLVLFMADASTVGKGAAAPLMQGYGGIIWATDESQAKCPSFVLVPAFTGPENVTNDNWGVSDELGIALRLLLQTVAQYSIDPKRLYTTGQSMGGMISFYLNANHPDLFAASLFVGSQWDVKVLTPLAKQSFFYIVSSGDPKASKGMKELGVMLKDKRVDFEQTEFAANLSQVEQDRQVQSLIAQGKSINFVQFTKGTLTPIKAQGLPEGAVEHMYSFDHAYLLRPVRDWLFTHSKPLLSAQQLYDKGLTTTDETQAFIYLLQSAKMGNGKAQEALAEAYEKGKGVSRDIPQAVAWYEKAIAQGVDRAMLNLGILYFNGTELQKDNAKAMKLFRQAWARGHMKAARYLGIMAEEGRGIAIDYPKAYQWYKKASDAGDITAADRIGVLYEKGLGVHQSYAHALEWYQVAAPSPKASSQNVYPRIHALTRLGYFYENGLGVKVDTMQALDWYRVAASETHIEAQAYVAEAKAAIERLSK